MWLIDSSIGRKFIMSLTGVCLVLFLTFHALMNVVVIISPEGYNMICAFLGANWYALVATMGLALGFIVHIFYAFYLYFVNRKARGPQDFAISGKSDEVSWASKNMLILGSIILGFIGLHLYNFWFKMQFAEIVGNHNIGQFDPTNGAAYVMDLFSSPIYSALYLVWLTAIWFHLTHGVWSALHSLGLNNTTWLPRLKVVSNVVSTVVVSLFAAVVVYYYIYALCGGQPIADEVMHGVEAVVTAIH